MKNKKILAAGTGLTLAFMMATSMTSCNKKPVQTDSAVDADVKVEQETYWHEPLETKVTEEEKKSSAEDPRYVPKGEKVSDDIPLNIITFADEGEMLFTIDISDCTLADLIETAELSSNTEIKVKGEGIVSRYDTPEFYLITQSFKINGGDDFDIETMIGNEIVADRSSYDPSDSKYTNPNTSYSEMKVKNLNISRTMTDKERLSFCDGEIGFGTPKEDVEKLLGKGKEFVVNKGESNEKAMYVWQNKKATLAIKYGDGTHTADKDTAEEIYVFANN